MSVGDGLAFAGGVATVIGIIIAVLINDRNNFNSAADILDAILRKERCGPHPFTNIDFSAFKRVLSKQENIRFDRCVEKYHQTKRNPENIIYDKNNTDLTHPSCCWYHDANPIIEAIDELLEFTKRK